MDREEKLNLTKDILLAIAAVGGILILAVMAPNAIQIFAPLIKKYAPNTMRPNRFRQKLKSLSEEKMITISEQDGKTKITITEKGKHKVLEYQTDSLKIKKQAPWDKKWRTVIFDIPEKKKRAREVLREKLADLGFEKIQDSVWQHKYPCQNEIDFLVNLYGIKPYVRLLEGESISF